MFLWGCVVYELMVGHWPGHARGEHAGRSLADIGQMIPRSEWPELEREHLGELVKKSWMGAYESSQRLRVDVLDFLQEGGWLVEDGDDLQFDASTEIS
jgi:hypothetical protein